MTSDNLSLVDVINETDASNAPLGLHDWTHWDKEKSDIEEVDQAFTKRFENGIPNPTLEPDWDVLHEIKWTLKHQLAGGKLIHTKGHQDDRQKYDTLSLLAQLNVDADKLAGQYQEQHGAAHPKVLLFPHAAAQLHSTEGTITSRLPFALRLLEHGPPLREYIINKNQWTPHIFHMINWESHAAAIKAHNKQRIHITKMLHEVLPTNYHIHRGDPVRQRCPSCFAVKEDRDHIIRCPATARNTWRANTIVAVQEHCHLLRTSPTMTAMLVHGLHGWFENHAQFQPTIDVPSKYRRLVAQQNAIGWRQMFHGRLSIEWARLHDDHMFCLAKQHGHDSHLFRGTRKRTGDQWCQDITTLLWTQWTVVWKIRNEVIHGKDEQDRRKKQEQENLRKLRKIYSQRELIKPRVQELLFDEISEHETMSALSIKNWLAVHKTIFIASIKQAPRRAIQGVRSIKSYFRTSTTSNPPLSREPPALAQRTPSQTLETNLSLLHIS